MQGITSGSALAGYSNFDFDTVTTVYLDADSVSKIGVTPNADESSGEFTTYKRTGVIAFMYDKLGVGLTLMKENTTTQYSAPEDKVNTFWHGLFNYVINSAYNMAMFYLEDLPVEPEPEPEPGT